MPNSGLSVNICLQKYIQYTQYIGPKGFVGKVWQSCGDAGEHKPIFWGLAS